MDTETRIAFSGTKEEQALAARAFEVMRRKGMLFGASAPIKMSLDAIVKALTKLGGSMAGADASKLAPQAEAVLLKNGEVFGRDENGDFVTTKSGHAPHQAGAGNVHTFKQRLNAGATNLDPGAAKEYAASLASRSAVRADRTTDFEDNVVEIQAPPTMRPPVIPHAPRTSETSTVIPAHLIPPSMRPPVPEEVAPPAPAPVPAPVPLQAAPAAPVAPTAPAGPPTVPAAPAVHPRVQPPEAPAVMPGAPAAPAPGQPTAPAQAAPAATVAPAVPAVPAVPATPAPPVARPAEEAVAPPRVPAAPETRPAEAAPAPAAPAPAVAETQAVAPPRRAVAPPQPVAPAAPVVTGPIEVRVPTAEGPVTIDLREPVDDILANEAVAAAIQQMVSQAVGADPRLVRFGSDIFPEDALDRISKGDFRRIKEYLDEPETEGFASDRDIMVDVFGRRIDAPDYERLRFSINYRMLREKKDYEFVGIDTDRLWISAGTSPVPSPGRKPAEIGQDYRFLEDPATAAVEDEEAGNGAPGPIAYSLTYYEYENGVLPYDRRFKRVFPGALFEDQRISLIRFEIPQLYVAIVAELRYPTGNRGGYILGLKDLFVMHMVPGAKFVVTPTDRGQDIFEIHFTRADEKEENLLQPDERRSRYVFRPVSYAIETDPSMLLEQEKFGKLHNVKKLDESDRKRPDVVIANAFDVVGEKSDGVAWAAFDDLFPVVNIERPISRTWLKTLLSGAYPFFYPDETTEGAYFYDPARKP